MQLDQLTYIHVGNHDMLYLLVFSQPLSGAGDRMIICWQVPFGAANGPCTQSQILLMEKHMHIDITISSTFPSVQDKQCTLAILPCPNVSSSLILLLGISIFAVSSLICPDITGVSLRSLSLGSSSVCGESIRRLCFRPIHLKMKEKFKMDIACFQAI